MTSLHSTNLDVFPLSLGTNVFGWTADEPQAFAVLDAYTAAGGNFLDTANVYGGGESETIIGKWLAARGDARDRLVVATKAGWNDGLRGETIRQSAEASLGRLGIEQIDLYYAHRDDPATPLEETLEAFDALVRAGKARYIAVSNYSAERLEQLLAVCDREGFARPVALQPHYNLMDRDEFEGPLQQLAERERLPVVPYFGLARGFLAGKYRPGGPEVDSARAERAGAYLQQPSGPAVLKALDELAATHEVPVAAVALAWLLAQPTVVAPIASARTPEQLADLLPVAELRLSDDEVAKLTAASEA
ncbi:MAG TPA: aldo/keto reductase [Conexibacter sp.]|jgi:aryl-alcohol dehydrogenase (NADP+)